MVAILDEWDHTGPNTAWESRELKDGWNLTEIIELEPLWSQKLTNLSEWLKLIDPQMRVRQ